MTQADLERITGIRPSTINGLYHDLAERVKLEHLDPICEALNCGLQDFIVRVPHQVSKIEMSRSGHRKSKE